MSSELVAFLTARLDEDERAAKMIQDMYGSFANRWLLDDDYNVVAMDGGEIARVPLATYAEHIAHHDPDRALADVDAKQRIVSQFVKDRNALTAKYPSGDYPAGWASALEATLRILATAYRSHPDYPEDWP